MNHIPVVNISKITGTESAKMKEEDLIATGEKVYQALSKSGFVYLTGHGIDKEIIDKAFKASRKFFELEQDVKDKSLKDVGKSYNNGYWKQGENLHDCRENYDFCGKDRYYPESCPEFEHALTELENACKILAKQLLRLIGIAMKLCDHEYFLKRFKSLDNLEVKSYTTFRTLYYPEVAVGDLAGSVRLAEHSDYGVITILFQDKIGGLQVKSVSGEFLNADPIPNTVLINTGDLLEFWSGGVFRATRHRVIIPDSMDMDSRQSIVFFLHPDDGVVVKPLIGDSKEYSSVTSKEIIAQRVASTYKY